MLSLCKAHDIQRHLHEEDDAPADEQRDEAMSIFLIKNNLWTGATILDVILRVREKYGLPFTYIFALRGKGTFKPQEEL